MKQVLKKTIEEAKAIISKVSFLNDWSRYMYLIKLKIILTT